MHKINKYISEELEFSNQTINQMKSNSKNFINLLNLGEVLGNLIINFLI